MSDPECSVLVQEARTGRLMVAICGYLGMLLAMADVGVGLAFYYDADARAGGVFEQTLEWASPGAWTASLVVIGFVSMIPRTRSTGLYLGAIWYAVWVSALMWEGNAPVYIIGVYGQLVLMHALAGTVGSWERKHHAELR